MVWNGKKLHLSGEVCYDRVVMLAQNIHCRKKVCLINTFQEVPLNTDRFHILYNYFKARLSCPRGKVYVTFFEKTDTNAFPFNRQNRLPSIYIRLNGSLKRLNSLLIRLKKILSF